MKIVKMVQSFKRSTSTDTTEKEVIYIFVLSLSLCNDSDQNKAKTPTVPGKEFDRCSCLSGTENDKNPQ